MWNLHVLKETSSLPIFCYVLVQLSVQIWLNSKKKNKLNKNMDADIMISKVQLSRMSIFMYWNDLNVVKSKTYALNKQ